MKSLSLIVCLIIMIGQINHVEAVTDAELEALEKQIEEQEVDEKKKAKEEVKRKAEEKRKAKAEAEKKRLVELEKKQRQEEARFAEIERQNQEEEAAKKRVEEEKKEKYTSLIAEAEQAVSNKDKELAMSKYNEALALYRGDTVANTGIKEAMKLMNKFCYELIGTWKEPNGDIAKFYENGIVKFKFTYGAYEHPWECYPELRQVKMNYLDNNNPVYITSFKLLNDNKRLYFSDRDVLYVEKISDSYVD